MVVVVLEHPKSEMQPPLRESLENMSNAAIFATELLCSELFTLLLPDAGAKWSKAGPPPVFLTLRVRACACVCSLSARAHSSALLHPAHAQ
eukprot:2252459-Pleurochrysis_carterae.AAC.1